MNVDELLKRADERLKLKAQKEKEEAERREKIEAARLQADYLARTGRTDFKP